MYITDKDVRGKLVELEVSNRKYTLTLYDRIIDVVKKFDGKVLNKRLDTALKTIDVNLSVNIECNGFYIKLYCCNNMVRGVNSCYYITNRIIYLNSYATTYDNERDNKYSIIVYDENFNMRLNAKALIEKLMTQRKYIENEIAEIEEKHNNVVEYERTLKSLEEQINNMCGEIPCVIKNYYSLQYDVRRIY